MIGFPNVGKSSCINAMLGITSTTHTKKRVAVAAQPGRASSFLLIFVVIFVVVVVVVVAVVVVVVGLHIS
jgi:ribosome biogenesis GTPase A